MTIPGQLNVSPRLLLGPGPSDAHPRVLSVMSTPLLGHLDPQFLDIMAETQEMIRQAYRTKNRLTFPISATGTAGMDDLAGRKALLTEFGIEIGGGLGDFKGKAWRIGIMGTNSQAKNVLLVLAAMECVMRKFGGKIEPGAGVAAAEKFYAAN